MPPPANRRCSWFTTFASRTARAAGHPMTFTLAAGLILLWAILGPVFHYSNTWQLIVNTCTTIVTVLMVFLIQNTQNRDAHAVQIKLDELIRTHATANNALLDVEELDDHDLDALRDHYESLARSAIERIHSRRRTLPREDAARAIVHELEASVDETADRKA